MATVMSITVGDNYGSRTRRCDAACHDATSDRCACICGGKNHGVGLKRALENTERLAEERSREPVLHVPLPFGGEA